MAGERCEHKDCRYYNSEGAAVCAGCGRELPRRQADKTSIGDLILALLPPLGLVFIFISIINGQPRRARNIYFVTFLSYVAITVSLSVLTGAGATSSTLPSSIIGGFVMTFGFSHLAARNIRKPTRLLCGALIWALIGALLGTVGKG